MINPFRKLRYRCEIADLEFHEGICAEYERKKVRLCENFGWYRNQDEVMKCSRIIAQHRYWIEHLKAQIYGGTK